VHYSWQIFKFVVSQNIYSYMFRLEKAIYREICIWRNSVCWYFEHVSIRNMYRIIVIINKSGQLTIQEYSAFFLLSTRNTKNSESGYLAVLSIQGLRKWDSDKTSCSCLRRAPDFRGLAFNCLEILPIGPAYRAYRPGAIRDETVQTATAQSSTVRCCGWLRGTVHRDATRSVPPSGACAPHVRQLSLVDTDRLL